MIRIGVVGDYRDDRATHRAVAEAIGHAADERGRSVETTWVPTPVVAGAAAPALAGFHGIWIAPGSPYRSMQGALDAIEYARTRDIPLLGTCGGFQHVVIEFARDVAGIGAYLAAAATVATAVNEDGERTG